MCRCCSRAIDSIGRWPTSIPAAGVAGSICTSASTATSTPCRWGSDALRAPAPRSHRPAAGRGVPAAALLLEHPLATQGRHRRRGAGQPQPDQPASPIHRSVDWNDADDTGWKATHYHEVIAMLKLGLGYAWLPRHLVQEELTSGALVPLDLASGNERHLYTYLLTCLLTPWARPPSCCCAACATNTRTTTTARAPPRRHQTLRRADPLASPSAFRRSAPASRRPMPAAPGPWPP